MSKDSLIGFSQAADPFDYIIMYCRKCREEYSLPEDIGECPMCGTDELEEA